MDAFVEELKDLYNYKSANVQDISIDYDLNSGSYLLRCYLKISAKGTVTDRYYVSFAETDGGVRMSIGEAFDEGSALALNAYPAMRNLFSSFQSSTFGYSSKSDCAPSVLTLTYPDGSMTLTAL